MFCEDDDFVHVFPYGDSPSLAQIVDIAQKHMEETFPVRLIEEMNRPVRVSAKDLGLSEDEARRLFPETDE